LSFEEKRHAAVGSPRGIGNDFDLHGGGGYQGARRPAKPFGAARAMFFS
jgi:hypothetical protein